MDLQQIEQAEYTARRLLYTLVCSLPHELGTLARAAVGIKAELESSLPADTGGVELAPPVFVGPVPWAAQLLALCCAAYDCPLEPSIPVAACLELLGIVSSALDSAQDNDQADLALYGCDLPEEHRYHHDVRHQAALVSNTGVALIGLAWNALLEHSSMYGVSDAVIIEIGRLLSRRWSDICYAQHRDLTAGRSVQITLDEYTEIVAGKAGIIGGTVCEVAAILVSLSTEQRTLWYKLGFERTMAQQLGDDCHDLEADLANGQQISQAILYGLAVADTPTQVMLHTLLTQSQGTTPTAAAARCTLITTVEALGATQYALVCQLLHRQHALEALAALELPDVARTWLRQWILDVSPLILADVTT